MQMSNQMSSPLVSQMPGTMANQMSSSLSGGNQMLGQLNPQYGMNNGNPMLQHQTQSPLQQMQQNVIGKLPSTREIEIKFLLICR